MLLLISKRFVVLVACCWVVVVDFKNLLLLSKVPVCHWISQKPALDASFDSSPILISSSFGDSAPQMPVLLGGPGGQADCHRSANVDIAGGLTGLFSSIRSNSSITPVDKRGSNYFNIIY